MKGDDIFGRGRQVKETPAVAGRKKYGGRFGKRLAGGGFEGNSRVVSGSCYSWTTHRVYFLLSLFLHLSFICFNRVLDLSFFHFSSLFPGFVYNLTKIVLSHCFVLHLYPILIVISIICINHLDSIFIMYVLF